jgi:hypothetical protein
MNLDCPELIADFHKRTNTQSKKSSIEPPVENNTNTTNINSNKRPARDSTDQQQLQQQESSDAAKKTKRANDFGYGRGLEIEKILGATDVYGELMFL